jgi:uncharacterized protein CbrC (UPF0167 family)
MALPTFKYHPDPVSTGHVVKSDTECVTAFVAARQVRYDVRPLRHLNGWRPIVLGGG